VQRNGWGLCTVAGLLLAGLSGRKQRISGDRHMDVNVDHVHWRALVLVVFTRQVLLLQRARLYGDRF
jgi:hypothetical protein